VIVYIASAISKTVVDTQSNWSEARCFKRGFTNILGVRYIHWVYPRQNRNNRAHAVIGLWRHGPIIWLPHALTVWDQKFQVCLGYARNTKVFPVFLQLLSLILEGWDIYAWYEIRYLCSKDRRVSLGHFRQKTNFLSISQTIWHTFPPFVYKILKHSCYFFNWKTCLFFKFVVVHFKIHSNLSKLLTKILFLISTDNWSRQIQKNTEHQNTTVIISKRK
jgi:hypothetical protein